MVGLLAASPVFAEGSKHVDGVRLIGLGLLVWSVAVVGCALSWSFASLAAFRALVGVGEASFVALAAPFIDDHAPAGQRTRWLAFFYLQIPVGVASGYVFGGAAGPALGWRAAFLLEALAMAPFLAFCARAPPLPLKGGAGAPPAPGAPPGGDEEARALLRPGPRSSDPGGGAGGEGGPAGPPGAPAPRPASAAGRVLAASRSFLDDVAETWSHPVYALSALGSAVWTAVLGAFAYWGPQAGKELYSMSDADAVFGGVTVVTGILGTGLGGLALDRLGGRMSTALHLSAMCNAAAFALLAAAFALPGGLGGFVPLLAAGQLFLFLTQAPVSAIAMWSVPKRLRPFACSLTTLTVHLLGDVPSPPLMGWLQERVSDWRVSFTALSSLLLLCAALLAVGGVVARRAPDYRDSDAAH